MSPARTLHLLHRSRVAALAWRLLMPVAFLVTFGFLTITAYSQEAPAEPPPAGEELEIPAESADALKRFRSGTTDLRTMAEVLPMMSDTRQRTLIRSIIMDAKEPPRANLVELLQHPALAVRLGSLELLEEMCDGDFSYNPWLPADSPENIAAFERWKAWAGEPSLPRTNSKLYTDEQRQGYLQDLLGSNADKASRARRMLEAEGLSAVGFLESFLKKNPALSPAGRVAIREAQYQITLTRNLGDQAATTARHLSYGSRDQLLSALATIRACGRLSLPILRDFINHPDPLVRETAIDSLLVTGGGNSVSIIAPLLAKEPDVNVIHGALRRLKDIPGQETNELLAGFLTHSDEDILVSATQTAISIHGKDDYDFDGRSSSKPKRKGLDEQVIKLLKSEHWRVRATALEYVAKCKPAAAKDSCIALLDDPDEFVRFAAIGATAALGAKEALPKLKAMLLSDESMIGPAMAGINQLGGRPDATTLKHLMASKPETKISILLSMSDGGEPNNLIYTFAADPNTDVACAALRAIAANDDLNETKEGSGALIAALRSNDPAKRETILEHLRLPSSSNVDPFILQVLNSTDRGSKPTVLDPLYDAFLLPGADSPMPAPENKVTGTRKDLLTEITQLTVVEQPMADRFRASLVLARVGDGAGFATLIRDLPDLTTAQKITIGNSLYSPSHRDAIKLLGTMMNDPVAEVRANAAECALSNSDAPALVDSVLSELLRPDTQLRPLEVYGSRFDSAMKSSANSKLMRNWCIKVLESDTSSSEMIILATIAARNSSNKSISASLRKHTQSKDSNIRRAAWHALLVGKPSLLPSSAAAIAADPEAFVREVLPNRAAHSERESWSHRFSDSHVVEDERWTYNSTKPRIPEQTKAILNDLATKDPAPMIRFEAAFSLLTHGALGDLNSLIGLIPMMPKEANAQRRICAWLGNNANRATPALAPLFQAVDTSMINASELKVLMARIQPKVSKGFATFASLAETADAPAGQPLLEPENLPEKPIVRTSLELIFFHKPGCPECAKARQEIQSLTREFPLLKLTEYNSQNARGIVLNQALCARFSVPSTKQSVSPAIFTQGGFLITSQITPRSLAELLAKTMKLPQDDQWFHITSEQSAVAATEVTDRYKALTPTMVILGGLVDGLNPCAFATIIFFLSYLQISRRTPREMLMVGAAFILAVFLAYLAAGLLLHGIIGTLVTRFSGVQRWMNFLFGGLALIAAILSFRDAWLARGGRLDEMTLQLPGFLKSRIRGVIRTGAKARYFVIAAFVSGLIVSLLELACTGQVYAPIIYQIQQGKMDAVLWLVIYNIAFIIPLIVIFILAYGGLRSEKLIAIQQKHTTAVKIALGILFLALALVIVFTNTH